MVPALAVVPRGGISTGGEGNSWPPGTEAGKLPSALEAQGSRHADPSVRRAQGAAVGAWPEDTCSLHRIKTPDASSGLLSCGCPVWEPFPACTPEGRKQAEHRSGGTPAAKPMESRLPPSPPTSTGQNGKQEPCPAGEAGKRGLPGIQEKEMGSMALCQFLPSLVSKQF